MERQPEKLISKNNGKLTWKNIYGKFNLLLDKYILL